MRYHFLASNLPFFKYFDSAAKQRLARSFRPLRCRSGEVILHHGAPVPGLFLVAEGAIEAFGRYPSVKLARLESGGSFGELSLIEAETAPTTFVCASDAAVLFLCAQSDFDAFLTGDAGLAAEFRRGAAETLARRLRNTNTLIESEMEKSRLVIDNMTGGDGVLAKLGRTQYSLNDTGDSLVAKLSSILPIVESLIAGRPAEVERLEAVKSTVNEVLLLDSQSFDLISQQMDQINQYLINIQRILSGLETKEVIGDKHIFATEKRRAEGDDGDLVSF